MNKALSAASAAIAAAVLLTGCGQKGYEGFVIPDQGPSTLKPVDDCYMENSYAGIPPTKEKVTGTVGSDDGMCVIKHMESYYDVTIDLSKGSHYSAGAAYADAIKKIYPEYPELCEGYIYENIKQAFPELKNDYSGIKKRTDHFLSVIREEYRQEIDGLADHICGDSEGFVQDGIISRDEAVLMQFVPDVLRGTACSALSASGNTTESGERITCRVLEWSLGSDNQICSAHTLLHVRNGEKSFVSLSFLGFLTILTAVNDDGLLIGPLDVGSRNMVKYTCENKSSYTYDMRYALENFTSAREAAEFLAGNAHSYPYSFNALATDKNDAFIAEVCVSDKDGSSVIRSGSTGLLNGLQWDDPEYLCAVNSFASEGSTDLLTHRESNIVRWNRYNKLFCGRKQLSTDRLKELMTCEKTDNELTRIRSDNMVHMLIADYDTGTVQAVLTGTDGVAESPEFIDLGSWK